MATGIGILLLTGPKSNRSYQEVLTPGLTLSSTRTATRLAQRVLKNTRQVLAHLYNEQYKALEFLIVGCFKNEQPRFEFESFYIETNN